MRSFSHWTPRYVFNRVRYWFYAKRNMDKPWITPEATKLLSTLLVSTDIGIEWGSGRSTQWFARRIKHLTSVEDNAGWYEKVKRQLAEAGINNVTYLHHPLNATPDLAASEYVRACDAFADESLGFALVDGEARAHCALAILPKIAPGGMLVIDNINWFLDHPTYAPASRSGKGPVDALWAKIGEHLRGWRMIWTSSGYTDTAIWIKPPRIGAPVASPAT